MKDEIYFDLEERRLMKAAAEGGDPLGFLMKADLTRADGTVEKGEWTHNSIVNLGYKNIWDVYFGSTSQPATFDLHLAHSFSPAFSLTSVIGEVTEVTGTSYGSISVTHANCSTAGNPMVMSVVQKTFGPAGASDWTSAIGAYLTTPSAAILICYDAFASSRTLLSGDTLAITLTLTREAATE